MDMDDTKLQIISFSELILWDVKRLFLSDIKSKYDIVSLGDVITERSEKVKLFEYPEKEFAILGVNNKIGLFDAYKEKGSNINQPYKKVKDGDLAYNPYRINVGSIGLKTKNKKHDFISPAYVVFTPDNKKLFSEYLYILFKTETFNRIINENTTGSVRQNLKYSTLANIKIPLPSLDVQNRIIERYNDKMKQAKEAMQKAEELENSIESCLIGELGIERAEKKEKNQKLQLINFDGLDRWGVEFLLNDFSSSKILMSDKFDNIKLHEVCSINPKTEFNGISEISFIPMKYISDKYGEIMNQDSINPKKSKGYTRFKENDLIWARITPCMQNGKSAIAKNLINKFACGSTEYHIIRKNSNKINMEFVHLMLRMKLLLNSAAKHFTGSAGQQRVPRQFLESLNIPIPPLTFQEKIVKKISGIKKEAKKLKKLVQEKREVAKHDFEKEIFND